MTELSGKLKKIITQIREEAEKEEFPVDVEVYRQAGIDPANPILFAGNLDSKICFFARDLGKDEVHAQQPLYGAAGRLVRRGVYKALFEEEASNDESLLKVLPNILLTNTVPYKPPGNKAYSQKVKNRFRPFLENFLLEHWQGSRIIPLGTEALKWFIPFDKDNVKAFISNADRFESELIITMQTTIDGKDYTKEVTLAPLPHPSPLNQKYYSIFPELLQKRLEKLLV